MMREAGGEPGAAWWTLAFSIAASCVSVAVWRPESGAADIAAGDYHTCTLSTSSAHLRCWGRSTDHQVPSEAIRGSFDLISAGGYHTCATHAHTGMPYCWGDNLNGQSKPPAVPMISIGLGRFHSCGVVEANGTVLCWGRNHHDQSSPPHDNRDFSVVVAGYQHSCGLRSTGSLSTSASRGGDDLQRSWSKLRTQAGGHCICWGKGFFGQTRVPSSSTVYTALAAGFYHTCGIRAVNRTVECWGDDNSGQATVPLELQAERFAGIAAGRYHTCGRLASGRIRCWGRNKEEQLSPPDPSTRFARISAGGDHSCGVRAGDSVVLCWGYNRNGESTTRFAFGVAGASLARILIMRQATPQQLSALLAAVAVGALAVVLTAWCTYALVAAACHMITDAGSEAVVQVRGWYLKKRTTSSKRFEELRGEMAEERACKGGCTFYFLNADWLRASLDDEAPAVGEEAAEAGSMPLPSLQELLATQPAVITKRSLDLAGAVKGEYIRHYVAVSHRSESLRGLMWQRLAA